MVDVTNLSYDERTYLYWTLILTFRSVVVLFFDNEIYDIHRAKDGFDAFRGFNAHQVSIVVEVHRLDGATRRVERRLLFALDVLCFQDPALGSEQEISQLLQKRQWRARNGARSVMETCALPLDEVYAQSGECLQAIWRGEADEGTILVTTPAQLAKVLEVVDYKLKIWDASEGHVVAVCATNTGTPRLFEGNPWAFSNCCDWRSLRFNLAAYLGLDGNDALLDCCPFFIERFVALKDLTSLPFPSYEDDAEGPAIAVQFLGFAGAVGPELVCRLLEPQSTSDDFTRGDVEIALPSPVLVGLCQRFPTREALLSELATNPRAFSSFLHNARADAVEGQDIIAAHVHVAKTLLAAAEAPG